MTDTKTGTGTNNGVKYNLDNSMALTSIKSIARAGERMIKQLQNYEDSSEETELTLEQIEQPRYTMAQAATLLNRSVSTLRKAEDAGNIPRLDKLPNGRKAKYTLSQLNQMREYWSCLPRRGSDTAPVKMSFQNFKGGVAKSTLTVHCAQYLASMGYRILLVDADSQASATSSFGLRPDIDVSTEQTLHPYLSEDEDDLHYAIRKTKWEGLDIIPACLGLYGAEYHLAAEAGHKPEEGDIEFDMESDIDSEWIERLSDGIDTVAHLYDVILIDPPPALGMISLSVLRAVDGLIIPTPPAMYDFYSTTVFFNMLEEVMETLVRTYGEELVEIEFVKILISKKSEKKADQFICNLIDTTFGNNVMENEFLKSAEIDNAAGKWKSVYDLEQPTMSRQTYKRCVENLDAVFNEVEDLIRTVWTARESKKMLTYAIPDDAEESLKNEEYYELESVT